MLNYIIFDLESTCWEGAEGKKYQSEIIEIGAVKVNEKLEIVDTFQTFIKPEINPILSPFCRKLTTIKQSEVENAPPFTIASTMFAKWCTDDAKTNYWLCSWGFYDRKMFNSMCQYHRLGTGWLKWHISIKHQYMAKNNITRAGMTYALDALGIKMEGVHHRGIDDAKNITKIFVRIFPDLKFEA